MSIDVKGKSSRPIIDDEGSNFLSPLVSQEGKLGSDFASERREMLKRAFPSVTLRKNEKKDGRSRSGLTKPCAVL